MRGIVHAVVYVLLVFFVSLGAAAGIYLLAARFLRPKAPGRFVLVLPARSSKADAAALLCAARLRVGLMGDLARSEVVVLDCGMEPPAREACEAMCRELDHTALLRPEELAEKLTEWQAAL